MSRADASPTPQAPPGPDGIRTSPRHLGRLALPSLPGAPSICQERPLKGPAGRVLRTVPSEAQASDPEDPEIRAGLLDILRLVEGVLRQLGCLTSG
jgi:hypothetical protein